MLLVVNALSGAPHLEKNHLTKTTINGIPRPRRGAHADGLPRLLRMSGPSSSDRETLGKRVHFRQTLAEIFGWLVGVGLLVEYWDEIVDCVIHRHLPSQPLFGGILVTAGVFLEVLFSRLALNSSDELQRRADSDVAQALDRAAQADLKRAELEASYRRRIVTRELNEEEQQAFILELKSFAGQKFALTTPTLGDPVAPAMDRNAEQWRFLALLEKLLVASGWVKDTSPLPTISDRHGVTVFAPMQAFSTMGLSLNFPSGAAASALAGQFHRLNISTQVAFANGTPTDRVIVAVGLLL